MIRSKIRDVEVPFYSTQKIYLAHEIGYWRGKLDDRLEEDPLNSNTLKFVAQTMFHYAGMWLELLGKQAKP